MKVLFYNNYPSFFTQLEKEITIFSHLDLLSAKNRMNPLTLPDYDFLVLAPWGAANEVLVEELSPKQAAKVLADLPLLLQITQARNGQLILITPKLEALTGQAEKEFFAQIQTQLKGFKKYLWLKTNPSLNTEPTSRLAQLVNSSTEKVYNKQSYLGLQTLQEVARITLACVAQLAVGAKTWGVYDLAASKPVSLIEILRLLKSVSSNNREFKPVTGQQITKEIGKNTLLENFGIHTRDWLNQLAQLRENLYGQN